MNTNPLGIRRLDHVAWSVAQMAPVIAFYQRVFEAQILYRIGPVDAAQLPRQADGRDWTEAHLGITSAPLPGNHVGSHHLGIEVDDMAAAAQRLRDNGCTVLERIAFADGPTAGSQFQYFLDPWRNILELVVHGR